MNAAAFRRIDAVNALGQYAPVITLHISLLIAFPDGQEVTHWKKELEAFKVTLKRLNKGKNKKGINFSEELVADVLLDEIDTNDKQDNIVLFIEGKGLKISEIDWAKVEEYIRNYAKEVCQK